MLDIAYIKENKEQVIENCKNRNVQVDIEALLDLDEKRRELQTNIDALRAERNKGSKGKPTDEEIIKMRELGQNISTKEKDLEKIQDKYTELLKSVPNRTHKDVPIGGEEDFVVLSKNIEPNDFDFTTKDHEEIAKEKNWLDFERGAKVVGSKFYFVQGDLVRLNRALIQYGLDIAEKHGFTLMQTPDLAKHNILEGIGFNPRGEETQVYNIDDTDLSLIGTAEITIGGYHQNEILDLSDGPKKYAALSHCYRTEAGAYGRTSKGLYRVHQFEKLELFVFCKPEESENIHKELLAIEEEIYNGLEIPYQVIDIATGDLGGPAYRKYDIEAWMTMKKTDDSQGGYGEISSASNCLDYQARRLKIRYKDKEDKTNFVHTLNGTAIALSRLPIAIIENFQQKDGSVKIPKVLQPYMGKEVI